MTRIHRSGVARRDPRRASTVLRPLLAILVLACLCVAAAPPAAADPAAFQKMQWWLTALQMDKVWQITQGAGVVVAVLDTGSDPHVGDLRGAVLPGYDVTGMGGNGQEDYGAPLNPHGTDMATIIAGRGVNPGFKGMAPQAKILPVEMASGSLGSQPVDVVAAINLVANLPHSPAIMNISSGVAGPCMPEQQKAILHAISRGIIVVASAGNEHKNGNGSENPANCVGVIAVGAYDQKLSPWSGSEQQPYVALAAPGVKIPSSVPTHGQQAFGTGTSAAAAAVSGMLALLRAKFPTMPARQLVARLFATTHHIGPGPAHNRDGSRNRNTVAGYGAALPYYALTAKVAADAPNPIYDAVEALQKQSSPGPPTSGASSPVGAGSSANTGSAPALHKSNATPILVAAGVAAVVLVALIIVGLARRSRRHSRRQPAGYGPGDGPPGLPPPAGYGPPGPPPPAGYGPAGPPPPAGWS
ncbi:MAG: hypothetical protein DLM58_22740 [Pseudonocardiales bacterium]|nr:MAG: hypothetical protein DLM58_22740 [Pseudonocardiales bacterium]